MKLNRTRKSLLIVFLTPIVIPLAYIAIARTMVFLDEYRIGNSNENTILFSSVVGNDLKIGFTDANSRYIALEISDDYRLMARYILIYDIVSGQWLKIPGHVGFEVGGNFSQLDSGTFFFSIGEFKPDIRFNAKIYRCDLVKDDCGFVFSIKDPAHSFLDFPDGRLLFVSGPPESGGTGMPYRYKKRDFHLRFPDGKIEKLTDLQLYTLGSINLTKYGLFINAVGSKTLDYPVGEDSEIYRLEFDDRNNKVIVGSFLEKPFISFDGPIVSNPSVLPDSDYIAFYRRVRNEKGNYRRSIIVRDLVSGKTVDGVATEKNVFLSRPIMIDDENFIYRIFDDHNSRFYRRNFITRTTTEILFLSTKNIDSINYSEVNY